MSFYKKNPESYSNLAEHYRCRGNQDKYQHYMRMAVNAGEFEGKIDEPQAGQPAATSAPAMPSMEEIIQLYNQKRYDILLQLALIHPNHKLLSYIAPSIHFARGNPKLANQVAEHIRDPEEYLIRKKTAKIWDGLHRSLKIEPRVHLLVLIYNREKYVEQALAQLVNTKYKNFAVYIADNGSSDKTWDIARQAIARFPEHVQVHMEKLPTNIGRPAGHNWLLTNYDHSVADYIAIGDDDLTEVPQEWMTQMVQTAKSFGNCAVVGGKALYSHRPDTIHGCAHRIEDFSSKLIVSNTSDFIDFGQFDYVDKVDHVTGCLHIYDRKILFEDVGLFDISLSPCQYVDVEHHLRVRLKGYDVIYNGLIAFRHLKAMGKESQKNRAMAGNTLGNIIKVLYKHDQTVVRAKLHSLSEQRHAWLNS